MRRNLQQNNHPAWLDVMLGLIAGGVICAVGAAVLLLALTIR